MINSTLGYAQLKFNIDVPDLEETYLDGYHAGAYEAPEESNPYTMGTKEYECWNEGWWAGFYQEEPLFDLEGNVKHVAVAEQVKQQQQKQSSKKYIIRTLEILSALLAAAVCYQLIDMAV